MKVRVVKEYADIHINKIFLVGEILKVDNKENSDFYHIWEKKDGKEFLMIIPKEHCIKL